MKYFDRSLMKRGLLFMIAAIAMSACGGSSTDRSNSDGASQVDRDPAASMTPAPAIGYTPTPTTVQPLTESAPGIDPNTRPREIKPGGSPIPGIPNAKDAVIKTDPSKSPAPGIPSEAEVRRMLNTPQDANVVNRPNGQSPSTEAPANKSRRPLGGKVD